MADVLDSKAAPVATWGDDGSGTPRQGKVSSTGGRHVAVMSDVTTKAESLKYVDRMTGTGTALGTTSDLTSLGLPYASLTFTSSGAVNLVTVNMQFTVNGGIIYIEALNGDTIDISALDSNGNSLGIPMLVNSAGTLIAATDANLTAIGTYYLYLGK